METATARKELERAREEAAMVRAELHSLAMERAVIQDQSMRLQEVVATLTKERESKDRFFGSITKPG
jgi:uncharacterized protein (DUF3084 family)